MNQRLSEDLVSVQALGGEARAAAAGAGPRDARPAGAPEPAADPRHHSAAHAPGRVSGFRV